MKTETFVDSNANLCKVTLTCNEGTFTGIAKCMDGDKFDPHKGIELAKKRALLQIKSRDLKAFQAELEDCITALDGYDELWNKYKRVMNNFRKERDNIHRLHSDIRKLMF